MSRRLFLPLTIVASGAALLVAAGLARSAGVSTTARTATGGTLRDIAAACKR